MPAVRCYAVCRDVHILPGNEAIFFVQAKQKAVRKTGDGEGEGRHADH